MSSRPRIAISTTTGHEIGEAHPRFDRINVTTDYIEAIAAAGGVPIMLPLLPDCDQTQADEFAAAMLVGMDALVLTGGHDLDPASYGQQAIAECGPTLPGRDRFDFALYAAARAAGLPVLGICRGHQLVNVAHGGTLFQDLPSQRPSGGPRGSDTRFALLNQHPVLVGSSDVVHVQTEAATQPSHPVEVTGELFGRLLTEVGAATQFDVVSFHHQAVDQLGEGLVVEATAPDGVVEALSTDDGQVLTVQWHPEMSHRDDPAGMAVFSAFVTGLVGAAS